MSDRRLNRRRPAQNKGFMKWIILFVILVVWIASYIYVSGDFSQFSVTKI